MERSDVMNRLWHSIEMHTIRRDFLLYLALFGLMWLMAVSDESGAATLMLLVLAPILVFYIWRTVCIFRNPEGYIFSKCELTQPHSNFWLKMMYFTVRIDTPDGRTHIVDTHAIFTAHGIAEPRMEDYVNSTVTIAYNPSTGMVVVIG